eukprot:m.255123 g.255123  ORF g.255123 m.255123 type:complete len:64 (+) comp26545_c0_seq4:1081-1272(+)
MHMPLTTTCSPEELCWSSNRSSTIEGVSTSATLLVRACHNNKLLQLMSTYMDSIFGQGAALLS